MKNASNETSVRSVDGNASAAIGVSTRWNFASWTFFSMTRFEPWSRMTRSSLGRLNAAVWTPLLASPAVNTTLTTRMGASAPSSGSRQAGSIGRLSSSSCSSAPNRVSCAVSASSRMVTKASKAAL